MKFVFNEHTDQPVATSNEWYIVYRTGRFLVITKNHSNVVANCGSLESAAMLAVALL